MKLNLGCGFDKMAGWLNADSFPGCEPDVLMDMEELPWPFADNQFDEIMLKHVLEHVGETRAVFFGILKELYRVLRPGGRLVVHVPHYLHENFYSDPTHVRAITKVTLEMLSKRLNREWIGEKRNATMLALMLDVDFELEDARKFYDPRWMKKAESGEISRDQLRDRSDGVPGMIAEFRFVLRAVK